MADQNNILIGAASLKMNGTDIGYTQGGVSLRKAKEFVDVDADQLAGVARKECTFERMFLTTTLLEATRANLQRAMMEPNANASGTQLSFGSNSPTTTEYQLTVTGKAPNGQTRTYIFWRAIPVDDVEHLIGSRDQASVIPIGFELLKDPAHNGNFGFCTDPNAT